MSVIAMNRDHSLQSQHHRTTTAMTGSAGSSASVTVIANRGPWAAESACPPDVPIVDLVERLLDLRLTLQTLRTDSPVIEMPEAYWPSICRAIRKVESAMELVRLDLERCQPWIKVVIKHLKRETNGAVTFYQLDIGEATGHWVQRPFHADRMSKLDRLFYALAYLPDIEWWRPVDVARQLHSPDLIGHLITKTVIKVFDDYRDDSDWLVWGTVATLKSRCEDLLERRRDLGEFWSWAPRDMREIRRLADRLGCEEPILSFEEENTQAAFGRRMSDSEGLTWPPNTDSDVRVWLKRVSAWCDQRSFGSEESSRAISVPEISANDQPKLHESIPSAVEQHAFPASVGVPLTSNIAADLVTEPASKDGMPPLISQEDQWPQPPVEKLRVNKFEANERAKELANRDQSFVRCGIRVWAKRIGCSTGTVGKTELWKKTQIRKKALRKNFSVNAQTMSPEVLETIVARNDDELNDLIKEQEAEIKKEAARARNVTRAR